MCLAPQEGSSTGQCGDEELGTLSAGGSQHLKFGLSDDWIREELGDVIDGWTDLTLEDSPASETES